MTATIYRAGNPALKRKEKRGNKMGFSVYATKLNNPNALKAFVAGFKTKAEAERFCAERNYKTDYFGFKNWDLIIKEI